jgi:uncharacterized protein YyaL (SSP411 family)
MMKKALSLFTFCFIAGVAVADETSPIEWHAWSPEVFAQAKREHRFVLLDLEAVWCHWCHVMDQNTYANPAVRGLMQSNYIAVRVDQDSRPDLSSRYEDYGWPATIVFNGDGGEIVKRQGYLPPGEMTAMLKAIILDPSPGPSVRPPVKIVFNDKLGLSPQLRSSLEHKLAAGYDNRQGGWGEDQKFLNPDNVEYCLERSGTHDSQFETMARQTLAAQEQLIDPAWGGVYQYSTDGDWKHPHFEKIMQFQAGDLRIYALAYLRWHQPEYRRDASAIDHYLATFLTSPEGAFYTSQDADLVDGIHSVAYFKLKDGARRRQGLPRIDKHIYAHENGWAIDALATFYGAIGDAGQLARAIRAADWIIANRSLPDGGFRHDAQDAAGPYLGDTLAMGRAFLTLYSVTGDRRWLEQSEAAVHFIIKNFTAKPGFAASAVNSSNTFTPQPQYNENVAMARLANLLWHYTGRQEYRAAAESALRWVAAPAVAGRRFADVGGVLLADLELNTEPAHLTVVGGKQDLVARSLWMAALQYPSAYRRLEWYDPAEGALPNRDVEYPTLPHPAAFICDKGTCSAPLSNPAALRKRVERMVAQ